MQNNVSSNISKTNVSTQLFSASKYNDLIVEIQVNGKFNIKSHRYFVLNVFAAINLCFAFQLKICKVKCPVLVFYDIFMTIPIGMDEGDIT